MKKKKSSRARAKELYKHGWRAKDHVSLYEMLFEEGEVPCYNKYVVDILSYLEELEQRDVDSLFSPDGIFY